MLGQEGRNGDYEGGLSDIIMTSPIGSPIRLPTYKHCALIQVINCLQIILEIDFANLVELRTFCTGVCVGQFVDYYAVCPDDGNAENVNTLVAGKFNCS